MSEPLGGGPALAEDMGGSVRPVLETIGLTKSYVGGDGTPITTKDVLFTWEVGKHPQSGVTNSQMFAKDIVGITAVDDKTFVIYVDHSVGVAGEGLTVLFAALHIPQAHRIIVAG